MSEDYNPYAVIKMMRDIAESKQIVPFFIGEVISEEPFIVEAKKLQFDREDLLINDRFISEDGLINLKIGDVVVLLSDLNYSYNILIERVR